MQVQMELAQGNLAAAIRPPSALGDVAVRDAGKARHHPERHDCARVDQGPERGHGRHGGLGGGAGVVGADQDRIHRAIYRLKSHEDVDGVLPVIDELMDSYGVGGFIAGCTEMHFISKRANAGRSVVDPLLVIAREWAAQSV